MSIIGEKWLQHETNNFCQIVQEIEKRDVKAAEVAAVVGSVAIVFKVVVAAVDDLDINVVIGLFHFDVAAAIQ